MMFHKTLNKIYESLKTVDAMLDRISSKLENHEKPNVINLTAHITVNSGDKVEIEKAVEDALEHTFKSLSKHMHNKIL